MRPIPTLLLALLLLPGCESRPATRTEPVREPSGSRPADEAKAGPAVPIEMH